MMKKFYAPPLTEQMREILANLWAKYTWKDSGVQQKSELQRLYPSLKYVLNFEH